MKKFLIEARAPRAIALVVAGLFAAVPAVHAAGFQLSEQSVVGMGRAQAGAGIVGDDLSAAFYNPAGMTLLQGTQVQAGGSLVVLDVPFKNAAGQEVENGRDKPAVVPNGFIVHRLNDRTVLGLGLTAPFGMGVNYSDGWIGRDRGISANIMTVDINPSVGYQLTDKLSVGVGASLQYTSAQLKKGANPKLPVGTGEIDADSWAMGYNLGMMYSFTKDTRIGLSYRSKVDHDANGDFTISGLPNKNIPGLGNPSALNGVYDGSASVTTPDSLLLSGFTRLNDQWALSGAVRYSNWKTFDALVIQGSPTGESVINNQWKASWMYSAGADYTLNQRATLRAGLAYETSPVPSAELKNPILPDTDRVWLSFGGSFKLNDKTTLDVAYTHLRGVGDKDITGLGEFKSLNAWIAGAQMQYRF
ncbi:MAG: OmpP1/FadL family transporter [Burkholderiaceae bacterium]